MPSSSELARSRASNDALGGKKCVNVPDFEMQPIISYGAGYWLWVVSAAILAAA